MSSLHYYNEIDPYCAAWLQNLMDAGHIPAGVIDTRSIEDVRPNELAGYVQCHFFAGIGGWPLALALAGWPVDRPVWTGSCPCQPFSSAGKGLGFEDERHLWPAWQHLIAQCRPPVVFGEQVASKDANAWIDLVHADLEGMAYAFGCVAFPAAGVRAPHIRERTFWLADLHGERCDRIEVCVQPRGSYEAGNEAARSGGPIGMAIASDRGFKAVKQCGALARTSRSEGGTGHPIAAASAGYRAAHGLAHTECTNRRCEAAAADHQRKEAIGSADQRGGYRSSPLRVGDADGTAGERRAGGVPGAEEAIDRERIVHGREHHGPPDAGESLGEWAGPLDGFWADADWLLCRDGKWRPVETGTFPLAHGLPNRVGRLRAYGNAIVPEQAEIFIRAYCEARGLSLADAGKTVAA